MTTKNQYLEQGENEDNIDSIWDDNFFQKTSDLYRECRGNIKSSGEDER